MLRNTLEASPVFAGLEAKELDLLTERFSEETFERDEVIFEQDARAEKLYVLTSGRVAIRFKPYDGDVIPVVEIEPGGIFGWSAALGKRRYTSCAVSLEESRALSILGSTLRKLCEQHPRSGVLILERLAGVIAERLQSTHTQVIRLLEAGVRREGS